MRISIIVFLFNILFFSTASFAQTINIQAVAGVDCTDNLFHIKLQAKSADVASIELGSFSIYLNYNVAKMIFNSASSTHFNGNDLCNAGAAAWSAPVFNATQSGVVNMTYILDEGSENLACPSVLNSTWTDIGDIAFDIFDFPQDADFDFDISHTHFNTHISNDGTAMLAKGAFTKNVSNCVGDFDNDGISDEIDNCPFIANANQADANQDGIGDICEASCDLIAYTSSELYTCPSTEVFVVASGFGGKEPYSYAWSTGENSRNIYISSANDVSYIVTVTDVEGCVAEDTVNVIISDMDIDELFIHDITNNAYVAELTDGAVLNYSDLPASYNIRANVSGAVQCVFFEMSGDFNDTDEENGAPYAFNNNSTPTLLGVGTYTITANAFSEDNSEGLNCSTKSVTFSVVSDCEVDFGPRDTTICFGQSLTLDATQANAVGTSTYLWSDGVTTAATIDIMPEDDVYYAVTVTDDAGCQIVDYIDVEVLNSGLIQSLFIYDLTTGLNHVTLNDGDVLWVEDLPESFTIEAEIIGTEGSIHFVLDGDDYKNHTSNSDPHRADGDNEPLNLLPGDYNLFVKTYQKSNRIGYSCDEQYIQFSIKSCPIVEFPEMEDLCIGETLNLKPQVIGNSAPYTFNWNTGATTDSLHFIPDSTAMYIVTVTNGLTCPPAIDTIEVGVHDNEVLEVAIWDLNADTVYQVIQNGDTYQKENLPSNYNFVATTGGDTECVLFQMVGDTLFHDFENGAPYHFGGDNTAVNLPTGSFNLTVSTRSEDSYNLEYLKGTSCSEVNYSFTIQAPPAPQCTSITAETASACGTINGSITINGLENTPHYQVWMDATCDGNGWSQLATDVGSTYTISDLASGAYCIKVLGWDVIMEQPCEKEFNITIGNLEGQSCNDNDVCTLDDVYDANCNCVGTYVDIDNNGICDALEGCVEPQNLSHIVISGNVVRVAWTGVPQATKYRVRYRVKGSSDAWREASNSIDYLFLHSLTPNTTYDYNVKAVCTAENSAWSIGGEFTTIAAICDWPETINTLVFSGSSARIMWSAVAEAEKYRIKYRAKVVGETWTEITLGALTSLDLNNLLSGHNYKYKMKVKCSGGWMNWGAKYEFSLPNSRLSNGESKNTATLDEEELIVFPNPVKDKLHIAYDKEIAVDIKIVNIAGKNYIQLENQPINKEINVASLPEGLYLLSVTLEDGSIISRRFVK